MKKMGQQEKMLFWTLPSKCLMHGLLLYLDIKQNFDPFSFAAVMKKKEKKNRIFLGKEQ